MNTKRIIKISSFATLQQPYPVTKTQANIRISHANCLPIPV